MLNLSKQKNFLKKDKRLSAQVKNLSAIEQELLKRFQKDQKFKVTQDLRNDLADNFEGEVLYNEPMSKHSYIKIGGSADVFLKPKTLADIKYIVNYAIQNKVPYLFHGTGANTLIKDGGVRGFVISLLESFQKMEVVFEDESHIDVYADAGVSFNQLVKFAKQIPAQGLESFIGIPGVVGGLVKMNAGTRHAEIQDVLREVKILDKDGQEKTTSREKLKFEYRKLKMVKSNLILGATFRLSKNANEEDLAQKISEHQSYRTQTQPLNFPNLGSVFKNPIIKNHPDVTAGKLIDEAGLKGIRVGGARISDKHANFIINEKDALAADVLALVNLAKDRVKLLHGIELELEWQVIGEDL